MAKQTPAVSIIIPMFNAEKYIELCLQSILEQTRDDFEVIVADDCSTDRSVELVKSFVPNFDGRLQLIKTKKNSGLPYFPRNLALKSARGKYITFLDNDDLLEQNALEKLIAAADQFNADFVVTEKFLELDGDDIKVSAYRVGDSVNAPTPMSDGIDSRITKFVNRGFLWDVWGKIFRRDFLIKNKIEFPRVNLFEDFCFFIQALVQAQTYVRIPDVVYIYRVRADSLSHDPPHPFDITRNMIDVFRVLDKFLSAQDFFVRNRKYRFMLLDFFVWHRVNVISKNIYALSDPAEIDEYLRRHIFNVKPAENVALTCHLFDLVNVLNLEIERLQKEIIHGK